MTIFNQSSFIYSFFQYQNCKTPIWLSNKRQSIINHRSTFPVEMATRNKRKLATVNGKICEEHPRSNLAQNKNVPRLQEDYTTQVSEEIEGRVTEKLSQEFSRTENHILGALARLDDFLINPLLQGHSGTILETSRNVRSMNKGTNEDDPQSNPHPEAGPLNSGQENCHSMAMGVQRECELGQDSNIHPLSRTITRNIYVRRIDYFNYFSIW